MTKKFPLLFLGPILALTLALSGCTSNSKTTSLGEGSINIPSYTISAPKSGKILGLIIEKGERISKAQPLFAIEDRALDQQLEKLTLEISKTQAELKAMENGTPGNPVDLQAAQDNYQRAQAKVIKMNQLLQAGAVSRRQAEAAQQELQAATLALQISNNQNSSPATPEELERKKSTLKELQQEQAQLLSLQQKNEALSPCTAIVTAIQKNNGALVREGESILSLQAQDSALIYCSLKAGQAAPPLNTSVTIKVKDSSVSFPGVVTAAGGKSFTVTSTNKPEMLVKDTPVIILKNES